MIAMTILNKRDCFTIDRNDGRVSAIVFLNNRDCFADARNDEWCSE